jgi:hypothetical protein
MDATKTSTPADLAENLAACGYREGPPPWVGPAVQKIDRETCADSVCGNCGHAGCEYHPFHNLRPASYRCYAVCPACGFWEEF